MRTGEIGKTERIPSYFYISYPSVFKFFYLTLLTSYPSLISLTPGFLLCLFVFSGLFVYTSNIRSLCPGKFLVLMSILIFCKGETVLKGGVTVWKSFYFVLISTFSTSCLRAFFSWMPSTFHFFPYVYPCNLFLLRRRWNRCRLWFISDLESV